MQTHERTPVGDVYHNRFYALLFRRDSSTFRPLLPRTMTHSLNALFCFAFHWLLYWSGRRDLKVQKSSRLATHELGQATRYSSLRTWAKPSSCRRRGTVTTSEDLDRRSTGRSYVAVVCISRAAYTCTYYGITIQPYISTTAAFYRQAPYNQLCSSPL